MAGINESVALFNSLCGLQRHLASFIMLLILRQQVSIFKVTGMALMLINNGLKKKTKITCKNE